MKQLIIGVVVFMVWLVVSTHWYVCGIRKLCEQPKPKEIIAPIKKLCIEPKLEPIPEPTPEPMPVPEPEPKVEEKKETILFLPTIYFIFEMDSVKNVDDLIYASKKAANYIDENPNTKLYINGYASDLSEVDGYSLGLKRSDTIKRYMIFHGVPEEKIIDSSKGGEDPKAPNNTPEGSMQNRRVEMFIK